MPWHPSANGGCERFNKVLLADMISAYVDREQKEWDEHLPLLTAAYHCCRHESTGFNPVMLMFGREVFLPAEIELGCCNPVTIPRTSDYMHKLRQKMNMVHKLARENTQVATERQKRNYDTRVSTKRYKVGDLVDYANRSKDVMLQAQTQRCRTLLRRLRHGQHRMTCTQVLTNSRRCLSHSARPKEMAPPWKRCQHSDSWGAPSVINCHGPLILTLYTPKAAKDCTVYAFFKGPGEAQRHTSGLYVHHLLSPWVCLPSVANMHHCRAVWQSGIPAEQGPQQHSTRHDLLSSKWAL